MSELITVTVLDAHGAWVEHFSGSQEFVDLNTSGKTFVVGPPAGDWYADDEWHTKPQAPSQYCAWDWPTHTWIDPRTPEQQDADAAAELAAARNLAHAAIEQWRDDQENAGTLFDHDGHTWDCGLKTRERLQPVLALPALPPGFFWTDADNEDVPVTLPELQALNAAHEAAMVARGFAIHIRQREMKADILEMDAEALAVFVPDWEPEQ